MCAIAEKGVSVSDQGRNARTAAGLLFLSIPDVACRSHRCPAHVVRQSPGSRRPPFLPIDSPRASRVRRPGNTCRLHLCTGLIGALRSSRLDYAQHCRTNRLHLLHLPRPLRRKQTRSSHHTTRTSTSEIWRLKEMVWLPSSVQARRDYEEQTLTGLCYIAEQILCRATPLLAGHQA